MSDQLVFHNTLTRKKEVFEPLHPPFVGLYVCGPTVYGHAHLGHARSALTFDLVFRYLKYQGYKVRYVRNITDVGHLVNDADEGDDKIAKQARTEQLEPMEIAQTYTNSYHEDIGALNSLPPSIEPLASGHIIEQIQMIEAIQKNGYAYEVDGSVYFDVHRYNLDHPYGKLSGRSVDDQQSSQARDDESRSLDGQSEKKNPEDFALWKKASPEHIMRWPSPWSDGFPGWHLECSAMSQKYLGETFDIHGGGMDLLFPHHECEIAQSVGAYKKDPVRYWLHNNMITINGQKMGKSLNNFITLKQFYSGEHELLPRPVPPMTIRFFILQAHYRSTLDFSVDALDAAEKGYKRLMNAIKVLDKLKPSMASSFNPQELYDKVKAALNDDLNSPVAIAHLFDGVKLINSMKEGRESLTIADLEILKELYHGIVFEVLGLREEAAGNDSALVDGLMETIINLRQSARENKDWATSDMIRDGLAGLGVSIKDAKEGTTWTYEG